MELVFIVSAIRRYFWIVIPLALLGAAPGLLSGGGEPTYRSRGVLLVAPPAAQAAAYSGDPDRYVVGQLSVLRSPNMAAAAAEIVGNTTPDVVGTMVAFKHETESDIVAVTADSTDPQFARRVVDGYLTAYTELTDEQATTSRQPIADQIAQVRRDLNSVDIQIADALAPYIAAQQAAPVEEFRPVPGIEQIAPSLVSQRDILVATLVNLEQQRAEIDQSSRASVGGGIVQNASLPSGPIEDNRNLLIALGVVGGLLAGVLVAVIVARLSPRVLDDVQAAEILGQPVFGSFPRDRALAHDRRTALEDPPVSVMPFVDSLCVRAEARASGGDALTVLVIGTQRASGTTTLAAALSNGFVGIGSSVLLVDADPHRPTLTALFSTGASPKSATTHRRSTKPPRKLLSGARATIVPNLTLTRFGGGLISSTMRRRHVGEGLEEARGQADVVVLDGGPLMAASSTLELARICDAVVLTMPRRQKVKLLAAVASELSGRPILPVWTRTRRSSLRIVLDVVRPDPPRRGGWDGDADGDADNERPATDAVTAEVADDQVTPEPEATSDEVAAAPAVPRRPALFDQTVEPADSVETDETIEKDRTTESTAAQAATSQS